jgi:heme/copper-type cytochrome/quinol oxidase subunit 3
MSTFVLLMSSLTMVLALAAVENKGKPGYEGILGSSKLWLLGTAILVVWAVSLKAPLEEASNPNKKPNGK